MFIVYRLIIYFNNLYNNIITLLPCLFLFYSLVIFLAMLIGYLSDHFINHITDLTDDFIDQGGSAAQDSFEVAKTGDSRIGFVGFPSVGKSTLLSNLAGVYRDTVIMLNDSKIDYKRVLGVYLSTNVNVMVSLGGIETLL